MTAPSRRPDDCEYRQLDSDRYGPQWQCRLVTELVDGASPSDSRVNTQICESCCAEPLPIGPQLNPVVAALVYSAANRVRHRIAAGCPTQAPLQQTIRFAQRFLRDADEQQLQATDFDQAAKVNQQFTHSRNRRRWFSRLSTPRIGLIGPDRGYGLAHQCRDIAQHLGIDRWLIPGGRHHSGEYSCRQDWIDHEVLDSEVEAWLDGLDAVLFIERPYFPKILMTAQRMGVRVICVPNWEWIQPSLDWVANVDLMLCPTQHTSHMLAQWKQRYRFDWTVACLPWPIDTRRIPFRLRRECRRFVYVHGSGGARGVWCSEPETTVRRKGLKVLLPAAERAPEINVIVYAASQQVPRLPPNVELRPPPIDNRLLYCEGDVCVQPSLWEGLGLPLLECQAAGMPLITTDVPPMNEHNPMARIPAKSEALRIGNDLCIPAARIDPSRLATVLQSVHGQDISAASRRARRFATREHSWRIRKPQILKWIRQTITHRETR